MSSSSARSSYGRDRVKGQQVSTVGGTEVRRTGGGTERSLGRKWVRHFLLKI